MVEDYKPRFMSFPFLKFFWPLFRKLFFSLWSLELVSAAKAAARSRTWALGAGATDDREPLLGFARAFHLRQPSLRPLSGCGVFLRGL